MTFLVTWTKKPCYDKKVLVLIKNVQDSKLMISSQKTLSDFVKITIASSLCLQVIPVGKKTLNC